MALPPPPNPPPPQPAPADDAGTGSENPKKRALDGFASDAVAVQSPPPSSAPSTAAAVDDKSGPPAKKKTKMAEAEKEEKRKEKEAKEEERRMKEEEKRKEREAKEEEKRKEKEAKEEERKAKEREREAKKAEREEKKRLKDEEKRKKEEALAKKARTQPKLDMFFRTPAKAKPTAPLSIARTSPGPAPKARTSPTSNKKPTLPAKYRDTYAGYFQDFFVKKNMIIAPAHAFQRDDEAVLELRRTIDEKLGLPRKNVEDEMDTDDGEAAPVRGVTKEEIAELLHISPRKLRSKRGRVLRYSTKDVLARIDNPDDLPPLETGLFKPKQYNSAFYLKLLNELPYKYLKFAEDVRPPYSGTYSKTPASSGLLKGRKPFDRALPGVDYDYDSEAEWVADEEGEELLSDEDEEDKDSDAGDSLDGFLDDEDDVGLKRGGASVLVPTNSGMCWEDANGKTVRPDLEDMRMGVLIDGVSGPIDPFSTKYWEPQSSAENKARNAIVTTMEPPRKPLIGMNRVLPTVVGATGASKKLVPPEYMEDFKRAIDGSDMTKAGLIEQLKKAFPKVGKDNIKNTLELIAERVGEKRDDKRWVLK
ncbi:chromatin assembly factor 1 subunit A-domain-containing protein [Sphaerosporella brunnea]|uniref:Chromatin assembly factor 1 subunit A-domain-containing protein n=1 Tax=Sphaerosporella brunnea TaxID=1250544 RepID=A0A5J5F6Q4_9PEZI|nr:chromatin assembly factor 1 subunit A-domain-containing protein [Sphaerosporella brunnea]